MSFSQEQRVFIVEHYFAIRSYARVVDEFRRKYPGVAVPNNSTITKSPVFGNVDQLQTGRDPGGRPS
jgi:hypothetical protein